MKNLYFVRHGQTEWNAIRRMQGQWNSDLSELGREHARLNGELLASSHRNIAVVSHGMIGKVMFSYLMDYESEQVLAIHQHNDMVFRVQVNGEGNDIAWFSGGKGPFAGLPE